MIGCYGVIVIVYWRYNHVVMMKSVVYDCVVIVMYGDVVMVM